MTAALPPVVHEPWWQHRLGRIGGDDRIVVGFAFDHRNSIARDLQAADMPSDDEAIESFKSDVIEKLAPRCSLVLLDHQYGLSAARDGVLPGGAAFAMPLEARRPHGAAFSTPTRLMDEWTPVDARAAGADACKLLLPLRMDQADHALVQLETCRRAVQQCHAAQLVPIIEPVAWPDEDAPAGSVELGKLAVAGARAVSAIGDLIAKVQYPGASLLQDMDEACAPNAWVLLGGGVTGNEITREVHEAATAGASGFLVGRTLFRPALQPNPAARMTALRDISGPLLDELAREVRTHGRPLAAAGGATRNA